MRVDPIARMELLDILISLVLEPALVFGVALGVIGAFLFHLFSPGAEPVVAEVACVVIGLVSGLVAHHLLGDD